jgi:hypothetical protein
MLSFPPPPFMQDMLGGPIDQIVIDLRPLRLRPEDTETVRGSRGQHEASRGLRDGRWLHQWLRRRCGGRTCAPTLNPLGCVLHALFLTPRQARRLCMGIASSMGVTHIADCPEELVPFNVLPLAQFRPSTSAPLSASASHPSTSLRAEGSGGGIGGEGDKDEREEEQDEGEGRPEAAMEAEPPPSSAASLFRAAGAAAMAAAAAGMSEEERISAMQARLVASTSELDAQREVVREAKARNAAAAAASTTGGSAELAAEVQAQVQRLLSMKVGAREDPGVLLVVPASSSFENLW